MIRIKDIQDALFGLVGWEQDYDPERHISEELTQSESGLYYTGAHPLMTLDNIRAIMPEKFTNQYPIWDADKEYVEGAKVRHAEKVWQAVADNLGSEPSEDSQDWQMFDALSDFLVQLTRMGIAQMVQTFLQTKSLLKESKPLLERRTFFDGAGRFNNVQENHGRLVGFEINPVRAMGVTAKIERIGLQMRGATGKVRVYLFHSRSVSLSRLRIWR